MAGVTPAKCYCGAERVWVYEGRIAFKCGTVVSLPLHGDRWRVRRTQGCIESDNSKTRSRGNPNQRSFDLAKLL